MLESVFGSPWVGRREGGGGGGGREFSGFSMWHFLKLVVRDFLRVLRFPPLLRRLVVSARKKAKINVISTRSNLIPELPPSYHLAHCRLHVINARCAARDLHTIAPVPLERMATVRSEEIVKIRLLLLTGQKKAYMPTKNMDDNTKKYTRLVQGLETESVWLPCRTVGVRPQIDYHEKLYATKWWNRGFFGSMQWTAQSGTAAWQLPTFGGGKAIWTNKQ